MPIPLADLVAGIPEGRGVAATELAASAAGSGRVLVVLDDDPTGTQSVADLPVLMDWSPESLAWAFSRNVPAVYVMTNSRSLPPGQAAECNEEVARSALEAARTAGVRIDFVSRSDSTLRGHFPLEPSTLADEVRRATGRGVDGIVLVPAFGDAGRITVHGVHYAGNQTDGFTPVGETEFARDATFGYASSDLREWVAEKSRGTIPAGRVRVIDLAQLRTDAAGTVAALRSLSDEQPVVCDIVEENDLRLLAVALLAAEAQGSRFVFRVGPPFVRAVIGQEVRAPLEAADVARIRQGGVAEDAVGGLVVVGSHVSLTTRQLDHLLRHRCPVELGLEVAEVLDDPTGTHIADVARRAARALAQGNVVVRTSRALVRGSDPDESLAIARRVSSALVSVVSQVLSLRPPRFVVAKGGITSSDVASRGLSIRRAIVRGPMLPGIVSLWEPVDGPARGIPYIVFAGNVGGVESPTAVVDKLSAPPEGNQP